jgi:hypothetical protein
MISDQYIREKVSISTSFSVSSAGFSFPRTPAFRFSFSRSLSFKSAAIIESFATRLSDYVTTKNTFKIPVDWRIGVSLVLDLVSARLVEVQKDRHQ